MRTNLIVKSALAATALLAAAGLSAAPASADSQSHRDPRGDVQKVDVGRAAKTKPGIDIVSLRNAYEGSTLNLTMTTAKLQKTGYAAQWLIVTADSSYVLIYNHTTADPTVQFFDAGDLRRPVPLGHRGTTCDGVKAKVKGDAVVGSVPRSCLDGANKVRIGGITVVPTETGLKADDSRHKGIRSDGEIQFGPALKRN